MHAINRILSIALVKREIDGALRSLPQEKDIIDFCSNDYLGFSRSDILHRSTINEISMMPEIKNGAGGSRLISGNTEYVEELEQYIAKFHKTEAGLIFNSGYDANVGLFSCVPQRGDTVIHDELIHASIRDGIRLSNAESFSFIHNDLRHLEEKLKRAKGNIFVAVESVYSMDGDVAPLKEIITLCNHYNALLLVDEAHATGVIGDKGEGLVQHLGLEKEVYARVHTFGKALGCHGAIVVGNDLLRRYLINFARSFIYTTALPQHSLAAIKASYKLLQQDQQAIKNLHELTAHFINKAESISGINLIKSDSAIISILFPGNNKVKTIANKLQEEGFDVKAIMSPTVPKGRERLRICIHSYNTKGEIDAMLNTLVNVMNNLIVE